VNGVNPLHAGAWGAWLLAAVAALSVTRNPIYLGLILAWIAAVWWVAEHMAGIMNPERAVPLSPFRFGLFVVCVSAVFNALMIGAGESVLFRLPDWLPLVGGAFTLEALVYGAMNGVVLTGLYAALLLVNRVLPVRDIVRLVPRAYHSVAIVVSIAVTFVPETMRQFEQIREAQAVRGHRVQGIRGFLPLLLPLLTGGMERALRLAEAMTARGYASAAVQESHARTQAGLVIGLVLFTVGLLLRLVWGALFSGALLAVVGALLVMASLWITGSAVPHTVYRPAPWRAVDWLVVAGAALTAVVFLLPLPGMERSSLYYYPYPSLTMPELSIWIGVATWGLLMPAVVMMWTEMRAPTGVAGV
jgi:energy-coupling factor transport system permease protein